jgi:class 3 adenylate cyclase/tetratricopeptide (TPR) repeat protein
VNVRTRVGRPGRTSYASHVTICPNCGHENDSGAKFCSECGTALVEARAAGGTERKVVTVLFADLVGFTSHAERLDPEDVQAVLAPYHQRLRYELERWGGTVEKFIGDAVMALFGAPITREDDPERAVRAALAIRDWIAEEGKLQVRIAVNTGEALVNLAARPDAGEGMAAGDVVNTAARLQSAAPINGILVGETTYRATSHTIDYRDQPPVEAKGKERPIPVWEVAQARARFGVDLTPEARTPLVGRDRELEQLVGTLERARRQRSPELVTLAGVPGIGKSRLVGELFQSIERGGQMTYWRQGRSLPYGEGVSYWALAEMVKAQAGILESDSDDEVDAKLARMVEQLIDEDAEWVLSHLRPLVGRVSDVASASQEEAFAAWRRLFEALAEQYPLVLVFEDIQWADEGLLDFIEHLADWVRDVPMLILCTARLELLERRTAWGGGKLNAATVALAPLSDEETAKLISGLSERPLLEAGTQAALLDRAGGNPLYAEQYVRMLAERDSAEDLPLPESVQGIIAARLDSLPLEEKALLQDAAVIGKVFWLGALSATEQQLHALAQKEFVQRARRSSVEGETEFAFKHLLVRDVAYAQIPRADRAQKHVRTAEWIESFGRPEDHAEMVAHHYLNALELASAAGQDVGELEARTRAALRDAGDRAAALQALDQAERYYGEALALSAGDDPEHLELMFRRGQVSFRRTAEASEDLLDACEGFRAAGDRERAAEAALLLAEAAWYGGQRDRVVEHLDAARSLVAGTPPSRVQAKVLVEVSHYEMLADRNESAIEIGREGLRMAEELGLDVLRANALNNIGAARVHSGDPDGSDDVEESVVVAEQSKDIPELIRAYNNLGVMHLVLGRAKEAETGILEAYRIALHYGHLGNARWSAGGPVLAIRFQRGEWEELLAGADEFLADETPSYQASSAYAWRGLVRVAFGDLEGAQSDAEQSLELARLAKDPQVVLTVFGMAAVTFLSAGNEPRAGETLDEILAEVRQLPQIGFGAVQAHGWAWVAWVLGRGEEVVDALRNEPLQTPWLDAARAIAVGNFRQAADLLAGIGRPAFEMFYRLRAADQLVAEGRRAEADEQLRPALAFYRGVGAARYVREGEALLAVSA